MSETLLACDNPAAPAYLYVISQSELITEYPVVSGLLLGRAAPDGYPRVVLDDSSASRNHGQILYRDGSWMFQDLGSKNGTYVDGIAIGGPRGREQGCLLKHGDVLKVGRTLILFWQLHLELSGWQIQPLTEHVAELMIGRRGASLNLAPQDRFISRNHASFFLARKGWIIADHGSTNGVYVNNFRLDSPVYLKCRDVVRIGATPFVFMGDHLLYPASMTELGSLPAAAGAGGEQLEIHIEERSVWQRFKKLTLLQNIDVTINPGELVLILGGSGAGKTTFMHAIMGYEKARGSVRRGAQDIYADYAQMKYEIGFVPQEDLLRFSDTVYETLENAARMKLSSELSSAEISRRIGEMLELMGLSRERDLLVAKLSGGQRKRLSIAVEYIGNPSLFFLDEPDSGLDGIMATSLMIHLRSIADRGTIVMVISHSPDRAADIFDKVIVLAKSTADNIGHLAFFGSVREALEFFEVCSLEGVVRRINRLDEGGDGLADYYIDRFLRERPYQ